MPTIRDKPDASSIAVDVGASPTPSTGWSSYPYDPVTILYADGVPTASYTGTIASRAPWGSKHTRGTYRPASGRLYYGMGDHQSGATGLPQDAGDSNANSALYSMDPNDPTTITVENHRYVVADTTADALQPAGADEGALAWDETSDRLICAPANSFQTFSYSANGSPAAEGTLPSDWTRIPRYVAANQFSLDGGTAGLYVGGRIRLHLNHPDFPGYTPDNWQNVPSWMDVRISAISGNVVTFVPRPGTKIHFTRDAIGFSPGFPQSDIRSTMWRDFAEVFWDDVAKVAYAGLLFMDPATRTWVREDFRLGVRSNGVDFTTALAVTGSMTANNGLFVPAAVTGNHDAFVFLTNRGPDGAWFGYYEYDLVDHVVNMWIDTPASRPASWSGHFALDLPCLDPTGKAAYIYCAAESWLYKLDFTTKQITRTIQLPVAAAPGGCGHCVWLESIRSVFIAADGPLAGTGLPHCYLYAVDTGVLTDLGSTMPDGTTPIWGDEWYQTPDTAIGDGGGVDYPWKPTARHVYRVSSALGGFQQLTITPYQRVAPTRGDPTTTDATAAATVTAPVWRGWGGAVVEPSTGMMYFCCGGHTEYQGMDYDWCDLSAISNNTMVWTQNFGPPFDTFRRRPHTPPITDGAYGNGGSYGLASDGTDYQIVSNHSYCRDTAHPTLGMLRNLVVPKGLTAPAAGMYPDTTGTSTVAEYGLTSFHPSTGNVARTSLANIAAVNRGSFGDWNPTLNKVVMVVDGDGNGLGDRTVFYEWSPGGAMTFAASKPTPIFNGGYASGWVRWLENGKYLVCRNAIGGVGTASMWLVDIANGYAMTNVTSSSFQALFSYFVEGVYHAVDRGARKNWFLVGKAETGEAPELYSSSFDDPGNIKPVAFTDNAAFRPTKFASSIFSHKAMEFYNGYLYVPQRNGTGGVDFFRLKVS